MKITITGMIRHAILIFGLFLLAAMVYGPLSDLFASRLQKDYHTLIPFIPIISVYLLYIKKKIIFENIGNSFFTGGIIIIVGIALYVFGISWGKTWNVNDKATILTLSALIFFWGFFIFAYGIKAFKAVLLPLLFLVFMIPIPFAIMEAIIVFLQKGSTEFANLLFWISHTPYYREGFFFYLPGMSIEVAPECSGIRSGLALFITALLAGYLFLNSWWRRLILLICVFPITMFKNGIRITVLTLLGTYVDPRILQSSLHREGGIPFFVVALLLMAPILYYLRKTERKVDK